jgi:hypothetical protein
LTADIYKDAGVHQMNPADPPENRASLSHFTFWCSTLLEYKIVMADGADSEVLAHAASLDIAAAAYMAAVAKHPLRNIALRQGAQVIKRHDGEPKPEPPRDPNLRSWSVRFSGDLGQSSGTLLGCRSRVVMGETR